MKKTISTAIAYANGVPHIGHAFEFVMADTISKYLKYKLGEENVFFETGMDEHGQKIEQKAKELNIPVVEFTNSNAELFKKLDNELSVEYDFFVRTSDKDKHYIGAQYLWNKLLEANTLEKKEYTSMYCVGCEETKTDKDLNEKGECPTHLKVPEINKEVNWFFKLSKYTNIIKSKIESDEIAVFPQSRKNEILALLERGLDDVSFSRPKSKVSWGIPVPNDDTQVMYVWCDALSNYITALGYGTDEWETGQDYWNDATHIIGKDILRFHAAIWPAMLLAADLPLPKKILVHGFITSGGQKMSKSIGNVIDPHDVIELFRPVCGELAGEALRFILLQSIPTFDDGDLTIGSIKASYAGHLQNGIGNQVNRIMKLSTQYISPEEISEIIIKLEKDKLGDEFEKLLNEYKINEALSLTMNEVKSLDEYIQSTAPFKLFKKAYSEDKTEIVDQKSLNEAKEIIKNCLLRLGHIGHQLYFFMPRTAYAIYNTIKDNKMPEKAMFNRLDK